MGEAEAAREPKMETRTEGAAAGARDDMGAVAREPEMLATVAGQGNAMADGDA